MMNISYVLNAMVLLKNHILCVQWYALFCHCYVWFGHLIQSFIFFPINNFFLANSNSNAKLLMIACYNYYFFLVHGLLGVIIHGRDLIHTSFLNHQALDLFQLYFLNHNIDVQASDHLPILINLYGV